jgi:hypothetical protein
MDEQQLDFIIQNLRPADETELLAAGITPKNAWEKLQSCDENIAVEIDGEPLCVFGYVLTAATIRFNFFGTQKVEQNWKQITRSVRSYMHYYIRKYPTLKGVIEVWEGHTTSIRWLKLLGFAETAAYRRTKYGRLIFVQFNKYNNNRRTTECVHLQPSHLQVEPQALAQEQH